MMELARIVPAPGQPSSYRSTVDRHFADIGSARLVPIHKVAAAFDGLGTAFDLLRRYNLTYLQRDAIDHGLESEARKIVRDYKSEVTVSDTGSGAGANVISDPGSETGSDAGSDAAFGARDGADGYADADSESE